MFDQSFKVGNNDPKRNCFVKHSIPLAKIKNFKGLIDNKSFFEEHVEIKQEGYKSLMIIQ